MRIFAAGHPCQAPGELKPIRGQKRRRPGIVSHHVNKNNPAPGAKEEVPKNLTRC
jgi:hypothetical protein